MILFNLVCSSNHSFECWFRDGAACDAQIKAGGVICPVCGDTLVRKAPMAPHIARGERSRDEGEVTGELRKALKALRDHVEASADYVGGGFAEEARRIHYGEAKKRPIYGEASRDDARSLKDEGIEATIIPWLPRHDS